MRCKQSFVSSRPSFQFAEGTRQNYLDLSPTQFAPQSSLVRVGGVNRPLQSVNMRSDLVRHFPVLHSLVLYFSAAEGTPWPYMNTLPAPTDIVCQHVMTTDGCINRRHNTTSSKRFASIFSQQPERRQRSFSLQTHNDTGLYTSRISDSDAINCSRTSWGCRYTCLAYIKSSFALEKYKMND